MKKCLLNFLKYNWIMLCFILITTVIELTAVYVTANSFSISDPKIFLTIVITVSLIIYYIRNSTTRFVIASLVIGLHGIVNLVFIIIYEMTGQMFDYTMLTLRKDAMAILESVPLNVLYFFVFGILFSAFLIFGGRYALQKIEYPKVKWYYYHMVPSLIVSTLLIVISIVVSIEHKDYYENLLYSSDANTYKDEGVVGNAIKEYFSGKTAPSIEMGDVSQLNEFLYDKSEVKVSGFDDNDYNVVTVLCESFEWMSIVQNLDIYPKGLNITEDEPNTEMGTISEELFPNLYKFYKEALVMTNFHSKEKTDIAENMSYLGVYPTRTLTNYKFPENNYATSMANTLKALYPNMKCNSFHNGNREFYNRGKYHAQVGFDNYYATEEMVPMGYTNLWEGNSERNLDGEMIDVCKNLMFPQDQRFFTYIITITQHGQFKYRPSLQAYYDKLQEYGMVYNFDKNPTKNEEFKNEFLTYVACAMELDNAIGKIENELAIRFSDKNGNGLKDDNEKYLKDNTIVTLFGDHNVYYNGISNKVKGFTSEQDAKNKDKNYLELYHVPYMIKAPGLAHKVEDKFTTTTDIVPTIFDLLGINIYGNFFYGNSVFKKEESILYSRAYGFFATENVLLASLNKIKFSYGTYDMENISKRAVKLVKKIEMTDKIFYNNYFDMLIEPNQGISDKYLNSCKTYEDLYYQKLREIQ